MPALFYSEAGLWNSLGVGCGVGVGSSSAIPTGPKGSIRVEPSLMMNSMVKTFPLISTSKVKSILCRSPGERVRSSISSVDPEGTSPVHSTSPQDQMFTTVMFPPAGVQLTMTLSIVMSYAPLVSGLFSG